MEKPYAIYRKTVRIDTYRTLKEAEEIADLLAQNHRGATYKVAILNADGTHRILNIFLRK